MFSPKRSHSCVILRCSC